MLGKLKTYWSEVDLHGKIETSIIIGLSIAVAVLLALCVYKIVSANGLELPSEVQSSITWTMIFGIVSSWIAGSIAAMRRL